MPGFKLWEIDSLLRDAIESAEQSVNPETGEMPEDWASFLDTVQMERDAKALAVASYVRELEAEAAAVELEKKRLTKRQQVLENKAGRVRDYLAGFLQVGEKLKDARVSIGWRKSSAVNVLAPVESLPAEYVRVIPEQREPDKVALGAALKEGKEIAGVELVTRHSVQIK